MDRKIAREPRPGTAPVVPAIVASCRRWFHQRQRGSTACRPRLEALESRRVPAQFGVPWHDAQHLTLSFVPDGTPIAAQRSNLFHALDAGMPTADWQREILRAFQTWAVASHINFALEADGGQPLGIPGPNQTDDRFGDIRIAARPMSPEALSISVPHDPFLSGTWSGDVLLNGAVSLNGNTLFAVLLHEVGHVLGLEHSTDPGSVMFAHLDPRRTALAPSDIAALRRLYGPRPPDRFEGYGGNDSLASATPFPAPAGFDGTAPLMIYGDITTPRDVDVFSLRPPGADPGAITIRLQTAGVSLLAPRLTLYDATGRALGEAASRDVFGDTLELRLPAVDPGATYYLEVRGAREDIFGVGEYALAVTSEARSRIPPGELDAFVRQTYSYLAPRDIHAIFLDPLGALFQDDHHSDDTFATPASLAPYKNYGERAPDRVIASLGDHSDVDVYRIKTPKDRPIKPRPADDEARNRRRYPDDHGDHHDEQDDHHYGKGDHHYGKGGPSHGGDYSGHTDSRSYRGEARAPLVMTVMVRATVVNGIQPLVAAYDADRNPVPALVLARGDGTYTIQVPDVRPDEEYFLRVTPDPATGKVVGNYDLEVRFGHQAARPTTFVESVTGGSSREVEYGLVVNQTQLFHLLLSADAPDAPRDAAVRMTLVDGRGRPVVTRTAGVGKTSGGSPVLLEPGFYRATFTADVPGSVEPPPLAFRLYGASLSDPIGPAPADTTLAPVTRPSTGDPPIAFHPAIGSRDSAYYWTALSLAAPGGARDLPTIPGGRAPGPLAIWFGVEAPGRSDALGLRSIRAQGADRPSRSENFATHLEDRFGSRPHSGADGDVSPGHLRRSRSGDVASPLGPRRRGRPADAVPGERGAPGRETGIVPAQSSPRIRRGMPPVQGQPSGRHRNSAVDPPLPGEHEARAGQVGRPARREGDARGLQFDVVPMILFISVLVGTHLLPDRPDVEGLGSRIRRGGPFRSSRRAPMSPHRP